MNAMTYIEPALPLLILLGALGVVRAWRSSGTQRRPWLEIISIVGICFLTTNVGAWTLSRPLEIWYSGHAIPAARAGAIVVLAGAINPPTIGRPYPVAGQDTYRRVQHAAWLFRNWSALPILASGGGSQDAPHAEVMRRMLAAEGIPSDMIWMESRSRNTHESAVYGSDILRARGVSCIVLVTEASSMPRASRSFRRYGFDVLPAPARFNRLTGKVSDFLPGWGPLAANGETVHELVGLAWYKVRGWI
jgi:uncharacterized SAM-binding protein YcdF (DUF218 family)